MPHRHASSTVWKADPGQHPLARGDDMTNWQHGFIKFVTAVENCPARGNVKTQFIANVTHARDYNAYTE